MRKLRVWSGAPLVLACVLGLGVTTTGCEKLGLGDKKDTRAKKADDDDDKGAKKKKKKKHHDDEESDDGDAQKGGEPSATATATASAPTVADDSTGIPECDEYVRLFAECIPDGEASSKKLRDGLKQGAQYARAQMIQTCNEGIDGLKKACHKQ